MIRSKLISAAHGFPIRGEEPPVPVLTVNQVHGKTVVEASRAKVVDADAMWTSQPGAALGIKTADCIPLLLEDPAGRRVAAVHSGWRGTYAEVAGEAVRALGGDPKQLRAAIGPCIRVCCYVVSEELAQQFIDRFGDVVVRRAGLPYLDLAKTVRQQLERAGVSHIDDVEGLCTSCDRRFHSYRREKGAPGRQVSYIVCEWPRGPGATTL